MGALYLGTYKYTTIGTYFYEVFFFIFNSQTDWTILVTWCQSTCLEDLGIQSYVVSWSTGAEIIFYTGCTCRVFIRMQNADFRWINFRINILAKTAKNTYLFCLVSYKIDYYPRYLRHRYIAISIYSIIHITN